MLPLLAAVPMAMSVAGSLGQGIYSLAQGIKQNNQANRINPLRPTYRPPSEIAANQKMYQDLVNSNRMPGQSIAENNIKSGTANSINAMTQAGGGVNNILAAIGGLNQNQNNAMNQLSTQAAQMNLGNRDRLAQANNAMAEAKNQAFDYNQNQPYMMDLQRKYALQQAGAANINNSFNGLKSAGSTAGNSGVMSAMGYQNPYFMGLPGNDPNYSNQ